MNLKQFTETDTFKVFELSPLLLYLSRNLFIYQRYKR